MSILDMLRGGNQPMAMDNPYQAQMAYQNALQDKQRARQMMMPEFQGAGKLGILTGVLQALGGRALNKKADESLSAALKKQFEFDTQASRSKAEADAKAEEAKYQRLLQRDAAKEEARAKAAAANYRPGLEETLFNSLPENMRGKAALGKFGLLPKERDPRNPTELEIRLGMAQQLGATPEQLQALVLGGQNQRASPEQREDAKLNAGRIKDAEDRARAAQKTLDNVSKMEALMQEGLSTGPLDKMLPGKDRDLFNALASDLNLSTLRQNFGGNPTEGERAANAATLPGVQQYETNNKELLAKLRAEAEAKINEFETLSGRQGQSPQPTQTAVNPQTGQKIGLVNGQWVPL